MKIIITGATGMVGEGVVLECLSNSHIEEVRMVNRRPYEGQKNSKLKESIVSDFFDLEEIKEQLMGYDACFYCAGKSSVGMTEEAYEKVTYYMVMSFAKDLLRLNSDMIFCYISGAGTDSTEKGKVMWARIKGKAENALMKLPFRNVYNFRPALMKPTNGQMYLSGYNRFTPFLYHLLRFFIPNKTCTIHEVGKAMINSVLKGYPKHILEVENIVLLAKE